MMILTCYLAKKIARLKDFYIPINLYPKKNGSPGTKWESLMMLKLKKKELLPKKKHKVRN
jgi:hypothetical protein